MAMDQVGEHAETGEADPDVGWPQLVEVVARHQGHVLVAAAPAHGAVRFARRVHGRGVEEHQRPRRRRRCSRYSSTAATTTTPTTGRWGAVPPVTSSVGVYGLTACTGSR